MQRSARLRRLLEAQEALQLVELAELASLRGALIEAERARERLVGAFGGEADPVVAWVAGATGAAARIARRLAEAEGRVRTQADRVGARRAAVEVIAGRLAAALDEERRAREAALLAEIIDQLHARADTSAAKV